MFKTKCHCENVVVSVDTLPDSVTSCNCSLCYRIGALWAYYDDYQVSVSAVQQTLVYLWGGKLRAYHSCAICNCVAYYSQQREDGTTKIAVNMRMASIDIVQPLPVRYFDGAGGFKYLSKVSNPRSV